MAARIIHEQPAYILTPRGWIHGLLEHEAGTITAVVPSDAKAQTRPIPRHVTPSGPYAIPGFIDLHNHGGGGADAMAGEASVRQMARFHASRGTTALCPTTLTAPTEEIATALVGIEAVRKTAGEGEARVLGVHLEGPFINPDKLGAQPDFPMVPDLALVNTWMDLARITVTTVAPELDGAHSLISQLRRTGTRVQLGHTLASSTQAEQGFAAGATGITHLFNAMSGSHHRDTGVAGFALACAQYAEIICDLQHVSSSMILAAFRAIPHLYCVSDCIHAAGLTDGEYCLGRHLVKKTANRVTLVDGSTLAGSVLTMDQALRNLVVIGISLADGSAMTSTRPAQYLGLDDIGVIAPGYRAAIVYLDENLNVMDTVIDGTLIG